MPTLWLTYGIPASGKSTWAKEMVRKSNGRVKRVNKDDLRAMIDNNGAFSAENEKFVLAIRDKIVMQSLQQGYDVIVDDTNFPFGGKHFLRMCEIAKLVGNVTVIEKYFDISLTEALKRNKNTDRRFVPEGVIQNMFAKHINNRPYECKEYYFEPWTPLEQDPHLPHCVIFDVDGTLALNKSGRSNYDMNRLLEDVPNENVVRLAKLVMHTNTDSCRPVHLIVFSGRDDIGLDDTKLWLSDNGIHFSEIYLRKTGDNRKDTIVKQEMFDKYIKDKYFVDFVVDDRAQVVEMWRRLGLTVLQCNYGDF
jgi:predicted kinase